MFLFLQSTRVDWLVVDISRRQKAFAQILRLVMWIRTISFAVGAHRRTSPFMRFHERGGQFVKDSHSRESWQKTGSSKNIVMDGVQIGHLGKSYNS